LKNVEGQKILDGMKGDYDVSQAKADKLLAELDEEGKNDEETAAKKKQKKWRNKINKIAKQEKITPEEVEQRLLKEAE